MLKFTLIFLLSALALVLPSCGTNNSVSSPLLTVQSVPTPTPAPNLTVAQGTWGGEGLKMQVSSSGATLEYDCAHGTIDQALVADSSGNFEWLGTHTVEHGGPVHNPPDPSDTHPARYAGTTDGMSQMSVTVTLTDTGQNMGTFSLTFGSSGHIVKCL